MIKFGWYAYTGEDIENMEKVVKSGQLSPGEKVLEFEGSFARAHGCEYGVMVNSGTDALRIALLAMKEKYGWKDGDYVVVPAITFVATINIVLQCGFRPLICDVGMYDYNLNPANVDRRIYTSHIADKVKAMIPVHIAGQPCDMSEVMRVAKKYDLRVIEDSCEAMGVGFSGKSVGSWGDIGCFSTYMAHLITTGVGGIATTNDPELHLLMRSYMNHGRNTKYIPGYTQNKISLQTIKCRFTFDRIGYSSRPTEFEATLGLEQLPRLPEIIQKRQENAEYLLKHLTGINELCLPYTRYDREHAYMFFPIVIHEQSKTNKWDLCHFLERNDIETRELLPITNQPCYKKLMRKDTTYSVAQWINEKGFYIPCHQYLKKEDLDKIINVFHAFYYEKEMAA